MAITVFNTLTNQLDPFEPITEGEVQLFVCGPTVYDYSHLGHAKTYTQFDFIVRYLRHRGYKVTYLQNITDIDNKIIDRANRDGIGFQELADNFFAEYLADMSSMSCVSVDQYAKASEHIPQIEAQVATLIEKGHAYELEDGWYFDLSSFEEYGKLSGRTELQDDDAQSRVDVNADKRHPGDFAVWKRSKPGEPKWDSELLGEGRPGWHIEDTAITERFFGPRYDMHGGARDLIFPHHEAEVALMESASGQSPLAKYWTHTGFLNIDGAKMSKSAGNFDSIRSALETIPAETLRYMFLSHHYRAEMDLSDGLVTQSENTRRRVENFYRSITDASDEDPAAVDELRAGFYAAVDTDFDLPAGLKLVFEFIRERNQEGTSSGAETKAFFDDLGDITRAFDFEGSSDASSVGLSDDEIESLISERKAAREAKDFDRADQIRVDLEAKGVVLEDSADGTTWHIDS